MIASLYELIPHQCHTCGLRCHSSDEMSAHLDYHFRLSTREVKRSALRLSQSIHQSYYWPEDEWLTADDVIFQTKLRMHEEKAEEDEGDDGEAEKAHAQRRSVQADESQAVCPVCQDQFDTAWDDDEEAWVYRATLRVRKGGEAEEEELEQKAKGSRVKPDSDKVRAKRAAVHEEYDGRILHISCYQSLLATAEPMTKTEAGPDSPLPEEVPPLEAVVTDTPSKIESTV